MTADDLSALNDQIAGMARAGLPLDQGLDSLARDMRRGRLRAATAELAAALRGGKSLPEALDALKGRVPPYYVNLVTAGVQTGRLPEVLATLATYSRTVAATRTIVVEALFYPTVVLVLGLALFGGMAVYILPQFEDIFQGFGLSLPLVTQMVLAVGRHPVPVLAGLLAVVAAPFVLRAALGVTPAGRRLWSRLVYRVPLVGPLFLTARLAAFTDLLGMLVEYHVPFPTAVRLAGSASSDPLIADRAVRVEARLAEGRPLAEAFGGQRLIPEWVVWLTAAGERRGGLAQTLRDVAALYRRQVESRAAVLRSVLPAFVVVMTAGVIIGLFTIAVMFPMVKLLEGLSK